MIWAEDRLPYLKEREANGRMIDLIRAYFDPFSQIRGFSIDAEFSHQNGLFHRTV